MQRQIAQLMRNYHVEQIEDALVKHYMLLADLRTENLTLIVDAARRADREPALQAAVEKLMPTLSLGQLVTAFELLIPSRDRKLNGAFFTPPAVARYIVEQGLRNGARTACDPSCGAGAILIEAASQIARRDGRSISDVVHDSIYGVDLQAYNVRRASTLLALLAATHGEDPDLWQPNLRTANSLGADWDELFPRIFANGGFDAVVGNPPYVRFQHLEDQVRLELKDWATIGSGNYNLYYAFFELGRNLLRPGGQFSFIVPNSFFTLSAAAELREWFRTTRFAREIVDFGHARVFEASVYTCIVSGDLTPRDSLSYIRLDDVETLGERARSTATVSYDELAARKWDLVPAERQATLAKIRSSDLVPLGELLKCRGGVATLRDKLYLISGRDTDELLRTTYNGDTFEIEREITVPCLRVSDHKTDEQVARNARRIIFPYQRAENGSVSVIEERQLSDLYPGAYRYLTAIRDELAARDKGRKQYEAWYAYGRTQGLRPVGPAIYTPIYADRPRFFHEREGNCLFLNGLALVTTDDAAAKFGRPLDPPLLQSLLDGSPLLAYYMAAVAQHIAGGYAHYRPALLHAFRIPQLTDQQADDLRTASRDERSRLLLSLYRVQPTDL